MRFGRVLRPVVLVTSLVWASVGAVTTAAAQTDPAAVLQQLVAAVNRNDVDAQVALVTDDVIFIGGPCGEMPGGICVGKDQFRMASSSPDPVNVTLHDIQV